MPPYKGRETAVCLCLTRKKYCLEDSHTSSIINAIHHVGYKKRSVKECPYWDLDTSYMGLLINCNVAQPTNAGLEYGNIGVLRYIKGTVVAQWLKCCATNRKVAGSIPAGVSGFFIDIIPPITLWPWVRLSL